MKTDKYRHTLKCAVLKYNVDEECLTNTDNTLKSAVHNVDEECLMNTDTLSSLLYIMWMKNVSRIQTHSHVCYTKT